MTSNLSQRVFQHRNGLAPGFTSRYGCNLLVFYEQYDRMDDAIGREKQIKAGSRQKKIELIEAINPGWRDLYRDLAVEDDGRDRACLNRGLLRVARNDGVF